MEKNKKQTYLQPQISIIAVEKETPMFATEWSTPLKQKTT